MWGIINRLQLLASQGTDQLNWLCSNAFKDIFMTECDNLRQAVVKLCTWWWLHIRKSKKIFSSPTALTVLIHASCCRINTNGRLRTLRTVAF